jgi:TP901 family phage tail tape measure protein
VRELTLKYVVQLASNIGQQSQAEAKLLAQANKHMQEAVQATGKEQDKLVDKVGRTSRDLTTLNRTIHEVGTNSSIRRQVEYFDRLSSSIQRAHEHAKGYATTVARFAVEYGPQAAAAAYGAGRAVSAPLRNYANLEEAQTALKIAMMGKGGVVSPHYAAVEKQAAQLGNQLPGTTKDFFEAAAALSEQGVAPKTIANGALQASSYFAVLSRMSPREAATTIAKVREASGLKDEELPAMADLMQRGRYAFGINPTDFLGVAKYAAPTYNTLGTTGLGNAKKLLAVQGMAASVGLEAESFGTNFSMMLGRLGEFDSRVGKNSAEAKAVKEALGKHGISMSFYDKQGKFSGIDNMLGELSKLRGLSDLDQQHVTKLMFGAEAGRPAQILIQKGLEQYRENLAKIDAQASMQERLAMVQTTLSTKVETLSGNVENLTAAIAKPVGNAAKGPIDALAGWIGGPVQGFVQDHPAAGVAGMAGMAAGGLFGAWRAANWARAALAGRGAAAAGAGAAVGSEALFGAEALSGLALGGGLSWASGAMRGLKFGGPMSLLGAGIEAVSVLGDESLTDAGRSRGLWRAGAGGLGGTLGGAAAGAALGSAFPVVGTAIGGIAGGIAGYMGAGAAFDSLWRPDAQRDYINVTAPNGAPLAGGQGGATVQLGEGKLEVNVRVTDDRVTSTSSVIQPLPLIKISPGSTNPGGF